MSFSHIFTHAWQRAKRGLLILKCSFITLKDHRSLWLFPLLNTVYGISFIAGLLLFVHKIVGLERFIKFLALFHKEASSTFEMVDTFMAWGALFIFHCISQFIFIMILIATARCVYLILDHKSCSGFTVLKQSFQRLLTSHGAIMFIMVGSIIDTIFDILFHQPFGARATPLFVLDIIWDIISAFVIPILAIEQLNLYQLIKRSILTVKNTLSETVAAVCGIILMYIGALLLPAFFIVICMLVDRFPTPLSSNFTTFLTTPLSTLIPLLPFMLPYIIAIFEVFVIITIQTIYVTVVYSYATGRSTGNFPPHLIKASFHTSKK